MDDIQFTEQAFPAGAEIIREGEPCGQLYILVNGSVEVVKQGQQLCVVGEPGAVFGELSVLLGEHRTATVRTLLPSRFRVIENRDQFVERVKNDPQVTLLMLRMLARRIALMDSQYVDLKGRLTGKEDIAAEMGEGFYYGVW